MSRWGWLSIALSIGCASQGRLVPLENPSPTGTDPGMATVAQGIEPPRFEVVEQQLPAEHAEEVRRALERARELVPRAAALAQAFPHCEVPPEQAAAVLPPDAAEAELRTVHWLPPGDECVSPPPDEETLLMIRAPDATECRYAQQCLIRVATVGEDGALEASAESVAPAEIPVQYGEEQTLRFTMGRNQFRVHLNPSANVFVTFQTDARGMPVVQGSDEASVTVRSERAIRMLAPDGSVVRSMPLDEDGLLHGWAGSQCYVHGQPADRSTCPDAPPSEE